MDSGQEQNYWPGFVDALSNVVLTLVFVLVIFVFALVMASNKVEKKMQEVIQSQEAKKSEETVSTAQKEELEKQVKALQQQLQETTAELQKVKAQYDGGTVDPNTVKMTDKAIDIQVADEKKGAAIHEGPLKVDTDSNVVSIRFPSAVADMDDKANATLGQAINKAQEKYGKKKIIIRSVMGREGYSSARRMAYYRALGVRNYLISKLNVNPSSVSSVIVQPDKPEDGRVEILFRNQ